MSKGETLTPPLATVPPGSSRSPSEHPSSHFPFPTAPFGSLLPSRSNSPLPNFIQPSRAYARHPYEEKDSIDLNEEEGNSYTGGGTMWAATTEQSVGWFRRLLAGGIALVGIYLLLTRIPPLLTPRQVKPTSFTPFLAAGGFKLVGARGAPHPILPLITSAREQWDTKLASQSTTFDKATRIYRAKYNLTPPPGFAKWFAFATQGRNHTLVDEYDSLMADLLPFRSLSPMELRRRIAELAHVPGISIVSIRSGVAHVNTKSGKWAPASAFQQMLDAFVRDLPDMDVAINEKQEGRVLPRRERTVLMEEYGIEDQGAINMTNPMLHPTLKGFTAEWRRDGSVWDAFRRACPTDSPSRRLVESVRAAELGFGPTNFQVQGRANVKAELPTSRRKQTGQNIPPTRELTFNHDIDANADICSHPSIHSLHSAFFSDQRSIEYLYPVFSPSKPAGYADILIPSHHYWQPSSEFAYEWEMKRGRTTVPTDPDWSEKFSNIYWRGKVTRGSDSPPGHAGSFQKQRLVKMANDPTPGAQRILVAFDKDTAALSSTIASVDILRRSVSDIAMACDPSLGECAYLRSLGYRVEPPGPLSEAWKHKYVLDLDEIGFSPKFLALMESKSAVVKSSVQREFWMDWIVPWKHYIPLSSSYAELYNIQTFFSGFPTALASKAPFVTTSLTTPKPAPELPTTEAGNPFDGDEALHDIADAGREWKQNFVRQGDMEAYVYRSVLPLLAQHIDSQTDLSSSFIYFAGSQTNDRMGSYVNG